MNEPVNQTRPSEDEIFLLDYLIILAKHSRMIIFVSAAMTLLTYSYLFCKPNTYEAMALLLPPQQNMTLSGQVMNDLGAKVSPDAAGGMGGGLASSLLGLKPGGDMYVAMMKSDPVLNHIITRFHLMEIYKAKYLADARKQLSASIDADPGAKDSIISIKVTDTNPQLAADIANAFIEELDRLLQGLATQEVKGRLVFLEKEQLRASQNLAKSEELLRNFSEQNQVVQLDFQTKGAIEYTARLRGEIDIKEVSLQVLRKWATPSNYEVVRVETEIKGLKEKLRAAEIQMANCVSDVSLPTSKAPSLAMEYLRLLRDSKFQEGLYTLYSKLVELAQLDMARDVSVIQVIARAMPPEKRANKRVFPSLIVGVGTFFMMILIAFGLEFIQHESKKADVRRLMLLKGYLTSWTNVLKETKRGLHIKE